MLKRSQFLLCFAVLLIGAFAGLVWYDQQGAATGSAQAEHQTLHSMGPSGHSHHSNRLETGDHDMPMTSARTGNPTDSDLHLNGSQSPWTVQVSPQMQQLIGVRVEKVELAAHSYTLRSLGKVAADETRVYPVLAATSGWIWETGDITTGSLVQKDQLLALYYSREFFTAQQSYFSALEYVERLKQQPQSQPIALEEPGEVTSANVRAPLRSSTKASYRYTEDQALAAKQQLFDLGMGEAQIQELERSREFTVEIQMRAPVTGFVLGRNIFPGQRYERGFEFFRIVDLRRVWILADVFEREAQLIRPGLSARVRLPHQERSFEAVVSDVLQPFDETTRAFKVRVEVDNPDFLLRPNMFADVEFAIQLPPAVTVPADAVLDSGMSKTVFVALGNGFFEPRKVETRRRIDDRVEIIRGIEPGESLVVAGNFLIDSESRMKVAAARMGGGSNTVTLSPETEEAGRPQSALPGSETHSHHGGGHRH